MPKVTKVTKKRKDAGTSKVTAKKKCCKDTPRCSTCPIVLARLTDLGYGERRAEDKRRFVLSGPVPKKVLRAARAP